MNTQFSIFVDSEEEADALASIDDPHLPAAVRSEDGTLYSDNPTHILFPVKHKGFFGNFPRLRSYPIL